MTLASLHLASPVERDRFVLSRRGARPSLDPWRHQGVLVEPERTAEGRVVDVATIFLTGRECPWRCMMCDLWQYTIADDTPRGALVRQVDEALDAMRRAGRMPAHVKLYNAGSFFDARAVPIDDYHPLAARLASFRRVIVESHPLLIGPRTMQLAVALRDAAGTGGAARLEVAMGLETAHPDALEQLHKRFTLDQFAAAAGRLQEAGIGLRVFLLVGVPFIPRAGQADWIGRSIAFAFDCGATAVTLIPTRPGNGALEALASAGAFEPPSLQDLEGALARALPDPRGRVFADLWDLQRLSQCAACLPARRARLRAMNLEQQPSPPIDCARCGGAAHARRS